MTSINGKVVISKMEIEKARGKSQVQRDKEFLRYCTNSYLNTCAVFYHAVVERIDQIYKDKMDSIALQGRRE